MKDPQYGVKVMEQYNTGRPRQWVFLGLMLGLWVIVLGMPLLVWWYHGFEAGVMTALTLIVWGVLTTQ